MASARTWAAGVSLPGSSNGSTPNLISPFGQVGDADSSEPPPQPASTRAAESVTAAKMVVRTGKLLGGQKESRIEGARPKAVVMPMPEVTDTAMTPGATGARRNSRGADA